MRGLLIGALLLAGCARETEPPATAPVAITAENADRLRQAGAEILFWSQAQRDANFPAMERMFPGHVTAASARPRALPEGASIVEAIGGEGAIEAHLDAHNVAGLIVVHDGKVRLERYARGFGPEGRYTSFSVAKSLTSTLVGAAVRDGLIKSVDDPLTRYLPELRGSAYDGVSVAQLLTMTSGVRWNEDYTDPESDVAKMYRDAPAPDVDQTIAYLARLPREAAPGIKWVYKTGETNLIGVLVTQVTGKTLAAYAGEKIWQPFGMERELFWMQDAGGQGIGGCCLSASLRDYARIGMFVIDGGRGVVPEGWFATATRKQAEIGSPGRGYGYQWWTNDDGSFQAQGIFGQLIFIDPANKLVVAMSGAWPKATDPVLGRERAAFVERIRAAAR